MRKTKKQTQALWTTPADPSFKLGSAKNKPRERADGLSQEVRDRELRERLKPFEAVLDSKTLNMHTGHPRMPEVDALFPPEGLDDLPSPDEKMVSESLLPKETCLRACMCRVDGVDDQGVHVTMRDSAGDYSRAILASALFHPAAYRDMRFLLIIVAPRQAKQSTGRRSPKNICRVKVLPSPEIRLSEDEFAELKRSNKRGRP